MNKIKCRENVVKHRQGGIYDLKISTITSIKDLEFYP